MGFMDFLNSACEKLDEFGREAQGFQGEYGHLSDEKLIAEFKGSFAKKTAIYSLLTERGYELRNGKWYR